MTLVKFKHQSPVLPDLFDTFFQTAFPRFFGDDLWNATVPAVNIREEDDAWVLEMAVPGMDKKDIHIDLNNDMLTIEGKKENDQENSADKYTRREFNYWSFKRSFSIPEMVDTDKLSASYKNGVLAIELPKKEEAKAKPVREIKIK